MLQRLIQWLKKFFQRFGGKQTSTIRENVRKQPPPPLSDADLEFLFTELLEGVHQARGQAWALKWLHNIEERVPIERWKEWLRRFGERLLASPTPNNELAYRMVQLGELEVGEVGDEAHNIGMQLLTRNQSEPIWEYDGPDFELKTTAPPNISDRQLESATQLSTPEGEFQSISLEQLFVMLQQDENLRLEVAQQLGIETKDPEVIVQALLNQFYTDNQSQTDQLDHEI